MMRADSLPLSDASKLDAACAKALELQLAGQLDLAGQLYRAVLQAAPQHAAANYCLGILHVQSHRPIDGLPYLKTALQAQLEVPDYWLGYLEALTLAGRTTTARNILQLGLQHGLAGPGVEDFAKRLQASGAASAPQPITSRVSANVRSLSTGARPYVVLAPAYDHRSAGVRVLHTLCNELNLCGHRAHLIFYKFRPGLSEPFFFTPAGDAGYCTQHQHIARLPASDDVGQFRALIDTAFVIYPEVIQANPLNAPRVVRYVLNFPAANGYPMLENERDFIVSFSRHYWQKPHAIATLLNDEPMFHDTNTRPTLERTMDCTYIGKGGTYGHCFRLPGSVYIDRSWPSDKESLAIMLRNTRYFLTWDLISQINIDALMCGAIPVVLRLAPFTSAVFDSDFGPVPYAESSIDNGTLKITHDLDAFESKRRRFIDTYKSVVSVRTQTVDRMATEIERYFAALESAV